MKGGREKGREKDMWRKGEEKGNKEERELFFTLALCSVTNV